MGCGKPNMVMIKKLIAATLLLVGVVIWMAPAPFYSPNYALSNQYPVIALGGGNLGVTNPAAFRALIGVTSTASTNNQTLTGATVISTNLLVDARTSPGTISPTNITEVIGTNGLKLFNIGRATGWTFMGTNVVFKADLLSSSGDTVIKPSLRQLIDSSGITSFSWELRIAFDASAAASVRYGDRILTAADENDSLDWENRKAFDSNQDDSLDWNNRTTSGPWAFTGASGALTNGIATYSATATNNIAATGITNTSTFNRHAMLTVTASAFAIKNYEGTIIYNSAAALTTILSIPLQPGGAITGASGLSGTLLSY